MQTVCEKLKSQRADTQEDYRALLARLRTGGKIENADGLTLALAGKTEDDVLHDLEDEIAHAADEQPAAEARRIREHLLPAARRQATQAEAEFQSRFDAMRLFTAALCRELETTRAAAVNYVGALEGRAKEMGSGPNGTVLRGRRGRAKALQAEQRQRQPAAGAPYDIHAETGARVLAAGVAAEMERLSRPFEPVALPTLEPFVPRDLAALVTAAAAGLSDAQRQIIREVAEKLLESTTEKLA